MTKLSKNTTPAERRRGCMFSELFRNTSEVVLNNGTLFGNPTINNGGTFSLSDLSYITYTRTYNLPTDQISISFKVTPEDAEDSFRDIIDLQNNQGAAQGVFVRIFNDNKIQFWVGNGSQNKNIYSDSATVLGTEYHIVCTYDGTNVLLYVDGVLQADQDTIAGPIVYDTTRNIQIGRRGVSGYFDGTIKEMKVWRKALTQAEVTNLFNNSAYNYKNITLADYPMNYNNHDPTNAQILDDSGNGNHLQFVGGTENPDKVRDGYDFDGTDDYVMDDFLPPQGGQTYSFFIKMNDVSTEQGILGYANTSPPAAGTFDRTIHLLSSGLLRYRVTNAAGDAGFNIDSTEALQSGVWYHCIISNSGSSAQWYINGRKDNSDTSSVGFSGYSGSPNFHVGVARLSGSTSYANAIIRSVKFFSKELDEEEAYDLYVTEIKKVNDI